MSDFVHSGRLLNCIERNTDHDSEQRSRLSEATKSVGREMPRTQLSSSTPENPRLSSQLTN